MVNATYASTALLDRVRRLQSCVEAALLQGELRRPDEVETAVAAIAKWVSMGEANIEFSLTCHDLWGDLWIEYAGWIESETPLSVALGLQSNPEWDYQEIFAAVALMYARCALKQLELKSPTGTALGAMAYADAVEHFERWRSVRGQARCRNPWDRLAELSECVDKLTAIPYIHKAKSESARRAALALHSRDPRQAAKMEIHEEWKRRRALGSVKAMAFSVEMHHKHGAVLSVGTINNLQTGWNKTFHRAR